MAKKYEYLMATYRQEELLDNLKSEGDDGWELCSATSRSQHKYTNIGTVNMQAVSIEMYVDCILKREKEQVVEKKLVWDDKPNTEEKRTEWKSPKAWAETFKESQPLNTEREWEIVAYKSNSSGKVFPAQEVNDIGIENVAIHSVKRLSDNISFFVGALCEQGEIKRFELTMDDKMYAVFENEMTGCRMPLSKLNYAPTPSQPQNNAPCRVRITQCSFEQGWYKDLIGEEFDVDLASPPRDYVLWEDYTNPNKTIAWRHIAQQDCVRISQPQNNKERIEVSEFRLGGLAYPKMIYEFKTSHTLKDEKYPAIKAAIEKILNDGRGN